MKNLTEFQPIHIVGIGGIGMSAIAEVLHDRGITVRGSDLKDGVNVRRLAAKGISVAIGHGAENIEGAGLVVLSSAVKETNPELIAARAAGLHGVEPGRHAGADDGEFPHASASPARHGKTTTTSMIAWIFQQAGLDPTVITGGIINDWGTNARIGQGKWFIVEADESDGTFVKLPTHIGVVTNIDPEHLDYYGSLDAMHDAFKSFFAGIQPGGLIVAGHRSSGGARLRRRGARSPRAAGCCAMAWPPMRICGLRRCARMAARCMSMRRWASASRAARGRWPI